MHIRSFVLVASVTSALALSASCAGSMEDPTGNQPVGSHAELVSKKREWLKGYHDDCQVCFKAFEQCKVGAASADEQDACQVALDACVRGGLETPADPGDGGVDDGDDGDADGDAGVGSGGSDDPSDDGDGDSDAGVDDGDTDGDADAGDNGGGGAQDPGKVDLIDDIGECLDQIRSCLNAPSADTEACIDDLKGCVKTAIDGAFENLCDHQISACVKERVPEDALQSVRDLCEDSLGITP